MIGFKLGPFPNLPEGVEPKHFSVYQRPYKDDLQTWRQARGMHISKRIQIWREIISAGDHYFHRGVVERIGLFHYHTKEGGFTTTHPDKGLAWTKRFSRSNHELYLTTIPPGMMLVSKPKRSTKLFNMHEEAQHMLWWESLYDACDTARMGALGWWWPYLTEECGGIVCAMENDAVLLGAEMVDV